MKEEELSEAEQFLAEFWSKCKIATVPTKPRYLSYEKTLEVLEAFGEKIKAGELYGE